MIRPRLSPGGAPAALLLGALLLGNAAGVVAAEDFFSTVTVDLQQPEEKPALEYRGFIKSTLKYGVDTPDTDYAFNRTGPGISRVLEQGFVEFRGEVNDTWRWQLSSKLELDLYQWRDGSGEWRLNNQRLWLKDAYLDGAFDNGQWLRLGHQILAWGEAEGLAITDVLNPLDLREPGQAELQDIREQIPAVMWSLPVADSKLELVAAYDAGRDRYGDSGDDFDPYIALTTASLGKQFTSPEDLWEWAIRWQHQFNGGDLSLMAADTNDNSPSLAQIEGDAAPRVVLEQARVKVAGVTANRVTGSWLFRTEFARYWDQPVEIRPQYRWGRQDQWRGMASVEYSGIDDLTVRYEVNGIYASDQLQVQPEPAEVLWQTPVWQLGHVLRVRHTAFNERLVNQLWATALATDALQILRWELSYDLDDHWETGMSVVGYRNNQPVSGLYPFRHQDSVQASVTYSF